jgi:hypothetical protein
VSAADDPVTVSDVSSARAAEGKTVAVSGKAVIAKLAPAVDAGGLLVYCMNLAEWAAPTVTVTGVLELSDQYLSKTGADGTTTAGTDTPVWLIKTCTVTK